MSEFVKVAALDQVGPGQRKLVTVQGHAIALFNLEGTLYAIDNSCPHSTGPLIKGRIFGTSVTCPWHGSQFDISDGQCHSGPASENVVNYPVHVEDETIFVEIT